MFQNTNYTAMIIN